MWSNAAKIPDKIGVRKKGCWYLWLKRENCSKPVNVNAVRKEWFGEKGRSKAKVFASWQVNKSNFLRGFICLLVASPSLLRKNSKIHSKIVKNSKLTNFRMKIFDNLIWFLNLIFWDFDFSFLIIILLKFWLYSSNFW